MGNEDTPRGRSLNTATDSFQMIPLADVTGSANSVIMRSGTE